MDDNHVIRIILEGKDALSGAFSGARKNIDNEIKSIRSSLKGLDNDIKKSNSEFSLFGGGKASRDESGRFIKQIQDTKREVNGLIASYRALKSEINSTRNIQPGTPSGNQQGFFGSAAQGFQDAKKSGQDIRSRLSTAQADVRARRAALDTETRQGQDAINKRKIQENSELASRLGNIKRTHDATIESLKDEYNQRQKESQASLDSDLKDIQRASRARIDAIKLEGKQQRNPLQVARRGESDPAVLSSIDAGLAKIRSATQTRIDQENDATDKEIAKRKDAANEIRQKDLASTDDQVAAERKVFNDTKGSQTQALQDTQSLRQRVFSRGQTNARAALTSPNESDVRRVVQDERDIRNATHDTDNAFQKLGRSVGSALGDLSSGFTRGRSGIRSTDQDAKGLTSTFERVGQSIGRVTSNLGQFVNIRFFALATGLQLIGGLVVQLAAAFVSLASSAAYAAAAVGTGFAAAVADAAPVVGLLAATFSRVQGVFKAVQLNNTNKTNKASESLSDLDAEREQTERLSDAQYSLVQAYQGVSAAQYNVKQSGLQLSNALQQNQVAILNLAQTRIDVSRGLVDAIFNERQATIDLRDAELGVVDAKRQLIAIEKEQKNNQSDLASAQGAVREAQQRLSAAQKENNKAGEEAARSQLAAAKSSVSAIFIQAQQTNTQVAEAKSAVQQANLNKDESVVGNKRTRQDSARTLAQGLTGNPQFIEAQREVKQSQQAIADARHSQVIAQQELAAANHTVLISERELHDAQQDKNRDLAGQISGQRQLKALLDQLTPNERKLYNSLLGIQSAYRKAFRPVTDIIVGAISSAVNKGTKILEDPALQTAAKGLAGAIAKGIGTFSTFLASPGVRKDILSFITNATKDMPYVVTLFTNLAKIFLDLAKRGQPLFTAFLKFVDRISASLDKFLNNKKKADDFFSLAGKNLSAWTGLAGAIVRLFGALAKVSQGSGQSILGSLTKSLDQLTKFINSHPEKVVKFFDSMASSLGIIAKTLVIVGAELAPVFTPKNVSVFAQFLTTVVIPALVLFLQAVNLIERALLAITKIPVLGQIIKLALQLGVAYKIMTKVFPIFSIFGTLLKRIAIEVIPLLIDGIEAIAVAFRAAFISSPWGLAIVAIITAIVLLDRKFHFLKPTIEAIKKAAEFVFNWFKDNWRQLPEIIEKPFIDAYKFLKQIFYTDVIAIFNDIIDWFKTNWKTIAQIVLAILLFPGGTIAVGIYKYKKAILGVFSDIVDGIVNFFTKLPSRILGVLKALPAQIESLFKNIGSTIVKDIIDKIPGGSKVLGLINKATGIAKVGIDTTKKVLGKVGLAVGGVVPKHYATGGVAGSDTVPAMLTPGEWVLNQYQQNKLAQRLGTSPGTLSKLLFGATSHTAHAAEVIGAKSYGYNLTSTGGKLVSKYQAYQGSNYALTPATDPNGQVVWFAEFKNGTFGQVSVEDANRILGSGGKYIPRYLSNASRRQGGLLPGTLKSKIHTMNKIGSSVRIKPSWGLGGAGGSVQHYAQGGPVLNKPSGGGNHLQQNFNVSTQGETDWNYVMRLSAIHAQESF